MRRFSIAIFAFSLFTFTFNAFAQKQHCDCLFTSKNDVPSMGNVIVVINEGKVKQIKGTVAYASGELMDNAVIEVFQVSKNEVVDDENAYKITENKKRKTACKTNRSGKFCFKDLPKGIYVLKIGLDTLKDRIGTNGIYFIVEVDSKNGEKHEIEATIGDAG